MLSYFASALFVWVLFSLVFAWLCALFYPALQKGLVSFSVAKRLNWRLVYAFSPVLNASLVVFLFSQPELIETLVAGHCHDELCSPHWLHFDNANIENVTLFICAGILVSILAILIIRQYVVSKRYITLLSQLSESPSKNSGYKLIDTDSALAWCAGLFNPQVYLSRKLEQQLTQAELNQVLRHEFAHASRHDNLRKWLVFWSSWCWPKRLKQQLRQDYLADTELICDLISVEYSHQVKTLESAVEKSVNLASCYCQSAAGKNKSTEVRVTEVEAEMKLSASRTYLKSGLISLVLLLLNLGLIFLSLHFGHPFLEWISA